MHDAAADGIDPDALLDLLARLVRTNSVHDPARGTDESAAAALVAEEMRGFGWDPVVEEVEPGRPNVIVTVEGARPGPTLLFEGHTDVVTPGDLDDWTHDPFGAEVVDGRMYGRGSADMKSGLAAAIHATAAVTAGGDFPGRIVIAALCDEEGRMIGAKSLVARGHVEGVDAAICCEPEAGEVCTSQKGAVRLVVRARGVMAHGAMPQKGRNPLPVLAAVIAGVADLEAELQREHGEHEHLGWTYLTPTVLEGGELVQLNVIPNHALLALDVRTIPGVDHAALIARVRSIAAEAGEAAGVEVEVEVVDDRPPTQTDHGDPVVRALVAAHRDVTGETPDYGGVPGTTDGTILWRDAGIPVVVYGPGGKWIAHQVDEYVEVADVVEAARVYAAAARRFLSGDLD